MLTRTGDTFVGSWDDIVTEMRDAMSGGKSLYEFMLGEAARVLAQTGQRVPTDSAEAFLRGSADAGVPEDPALTLTTQRTVFPNGFTLLVRRTAPRRWWRSSRA